MGGNSFINQSHNMTAGSIPSTSSGAPNRQDSTTTASTVLPAKGETIVIHVFDENRKINKDFTCDKDLLIQHMKYFEKYLTDTTSVDDIDISVHCDIKIFEWLMRYLKLRESGFTLAQAKAAADAN